MPRRREITPDHYTVDENGCWLWARSVTRGGYGRFLGQGAHRIAYSQANGPIPDGLTVDHLCFTPRCVNPAHLRLLTMLENASNQRLALSPTCHAGHQFTPENTYWIARKETGRRRRRCKTCLRDWKALAVRRRQGLAA